MVNRKLFVTSPDTNAPTNCYGVYHFIDTAGGTMTHFSFVFFTMGGAMDRADIKSQITSSANTYAAANSITITDTQWWYEEQIQSDWNQASSGALDFIKNKPTIPAAQIQSDWNQASSGALDFIKNKPAITSGTVTSVGVTSTDFSVSGSPVTTSGNITLNLNTTGVSADTYSAVTVNTKGQVTAATKRSFNNTPSRSIVTGTGATGFQVSSTRDSSVNYSATIVSTATIAGAATGYIALEISPTNSATAGDWVEIGRTPNGQAVSLAVVLQSVSTGGGQVGGIIPAGYYAKLRSVNTAGTPTYTYNSGQEVLL